MTNDERLRTMVLTYEASDGDAEKFAVVLGAVAENFRGVKLHEFVDDTIFDDADDRGAVDALYARLTSEGSITEEQQEQLEGFAALLRDWSGEVDDT